jgi:hypothetical protein
VVGSPVHLIANEVEKNVDIELVRAAGTGLYGRLIVAGTESAAGMAEQTALGVIDSVRQNALVAGDPAGGR